MTDDKFNKPADYVTGMTFVENVSYNVAQQIIITSADKLYRPLHEWKEDIERSRYPWTGPVPLFVSLLLATVTSDTKNMLGVSKELWAGFFFFATVAAGIWMLYSFVQLARGCASIDAVINKIKNTQPDLKQPDQNPASTK